MKLMLLVMLALTACAQEPVWIDLSGEWKIERSDRAEFASPGYDDRDWERVTMPFGEARLGEGPFWLRKQVRLAEGRQGTPLWLTVGVLEVYEIYINGKRAGANGGFDTFEDAPIPQPRTFRIPRELTAGSGSVQIALRVRNPLFATTMWLLPDEGPWLLTSDATVPQAAGDYARAKRWIAKSPRLVFGTAFLLLAVISFVAWSMDRERRELLWFAIYLTALGGTGFESLLNWTPETHPYLWNGAGYSPLLLSGLVSALFGQLVIAALGIRQRWITAILWMGWLANPIGVLLSRSPSTGNFLGNSWVNCVSLILIAWDWWRWSGKSSTAEKALRIALLAPPILGLRNRLPGLLGVGSSSGRFLNVGPWLIFWQDAAALLLSIVILTVLFRRFAADRQERQRMSTELEAARSVQQMLLQQAALADPGLQLEAVYLPAQEVGGDFYAVLDGRTVVTGDVSGKGLKAAMLVSLLIGVLRETKERRPGLVLAALNRAIAGRIEGGFVTCCCVRFEADGAATVANAGHVAPYCDGEEVAVEAGLPLGLTVDVEYTEAVVRGRMFTMVSDGVVEAATSGGELLGFERTRAMSGQAAGEIAEAARAWGQNDDITVVTVRRVG